jgi:hypothetical protein
MALHCRFCGLEAFRPSLFRFQALDIGQLLLLRLPVRCLNCDVRTFSSLIGFLKLRNQHRVRLRAQNGSL